MRNRNFYLRGKTYAMLMVVGTLLFASCAIGYESPNGFDTGVSNQQVVTPIADSISFKISTDGKTGVISWPPVMGALAFEVTFRNVDDPEKDSIISGYDKKIVDGCNISVALAEDSKYQLELRALGNKKYGNTDDEEPTICPLSTLVPAIATIPSGSDIYEYLTANPLPEPVSDEVAIELEANGQYTLSGPIDFGGQKMTFRGDKIHRPTVAVSGTGNISTYSGLKIKNINFDCSNMPYNANSGFITPSKNIPPDSISGIKGSVLGYAKSTCNYIKDPIYISKCWIKDLPGSFLCDNRSSEFALLNFTIEDCIIQRTGTSGYFIDFTKKGRSIHTILFKNSTIYNTQDWSGNFVRYYNDSESQPKKSFGTTPSLLATTLTFANCTFAKMPSKGRYMARNFQRSIANMNLSHCIFYDMSGMNKFVTGVKSYSFNVWYAFTDPNTGDPAMKDNKGAPLASEYDPKFVGDITQSLDLTQPNGGVNFTPQEYEIISNSCGDPRWLPTY